MVAAMVLLPTSSDHRSLSQHPRPALGFRPQERAATRLPHTDWPVDRGRSSPIHPRPSTWSSLREGPSNRRGWSGRARKDTKDDILAPWRPPGYEEGPMPRPLPTPDGGAAQGRREGDREKEGGRRKGGKKDRREGGMVGRIGGGRDGKIGGGGVRRKEAGRDRRSEGWRKKRSERRQS